MKNKELKGRVTDITKQGATIRLIDENGNETGEEYFAHLGDIKENENLLYDLRDHKINDLNTVYSHFVKLETNQIVKFRGWDKIKNHAFNVHK